MNEVRIEFSLAELQALILISARGLEVTDGLTAEEKQAARSAMQALSGALKKDRRDSRG